VKRCKGDYKSRGKEKNKYAKEKRYRFFNVCFLYRMLGTCAFTAVVRGWQELDKALREGGETMQLTDEQLEIIREAARTVEYGSVTVHISAASNHFDYEVHKRVRQENEGEEKNIGSFHGKKQSRVPMTPKKRYTPGKI
jgi:hypothetical protein